VNSAAPADFHTRVRHQLRQDAMNAAYRIMIEQDWAAVRMTAIAAAVGVSRQTLYKEFRSKQEIGEALVIREAEQFIGGVTRHLQPHDEVSAAIEAVIRFTFEHGAANPLLLAILAGTRGGGDTLLPLVTTDAQPLIAMAGQVLGEHITRRAPWLEVEDAVATADALARLTVSHLLQPLDDPEITIRRLTRLARRNLGLERARRTPSGT
jgi:AcrR family transcriptional regulator